MSWKRKFKNKHGFWPHEEKCKCGWRRADHTVWNTNKEFTCEQFEGMGCK